MKQPTEGALRAPLACSPDSVLAFVLVLIYVSIMCFFLSLCGRFARLHYADRIMWQCSLLLSPIRFSLWEAPHNLFDRRGNCS